MFLGYQGILLEIWVFVRGSLGSVFLLQCYDPIVLLSDQGVGLIQGGKDGGHGMVSLGWLGDQEGVLKNGLLMIFVAITSVVESGIVTGILLGRKSRVAITRLRGVGVRRYDELDVILSHLRSIWRNHRCYHP